MLELGKGSLVIQALTGQGKGSVLIRSWYPPLPKLLRSGTFLVPFPSTDPAKGLFLQGCAFYEEKLGKNTVKMIVRELAAPVYAQSYH